MSVQLTGHAHSAQVWSASSSHSGQSQKLSLNRWTGNSQPLELHGSVVTVSVGHAKGSGRGAGCKGLDPFTTISRFLWWIWIKPPESH